MSDKDKKNDNNLPDNNRRNFVLAGALSAATLATGLGIPAASAAPKKHKKNGQ